MNEKYTYPNGEPWPKDYIEWFESGPLTPEILDTWLSIIRDTKETK